MNKLAGWTPKLLYSRGRSLGKRRDVQLEDKEDVEEDAHLFRFSWLDKVCVCVCMCLGTCVS